MSKQVKTRLREPAFTDFHPNTEHVKKRVLATFPCIVRKVAVLRFDFGPLTPKIGSWIRGLSATEMDEFDARRS